MYYQLILEETLGKGGRINLTKELSKAQERPPSMYLD